MAYIAPTDTVYSGGTASTVQNGKVISTAPDTINPPTPGAAVPTKAPSTSQPANATQAPAVFSSTAASNKINSQIIPAMNTGNAGIAAQNQKNTIDPNYQMTPQELANPALYTARIAAYNASKAGTTAPPTSTPPSAADQAMKDAANTPDPGFQFAYDADGNKQQVQQGAPLAPGLTLTPPADPTKTGHTVVQSTTTADGATYQQYSDGSYGIADQNGQFAGTATQQDYQNAYDNSPSTVIQHIQSSLASLSAGAVPLTEPQQAQINALNTQLAQNVATQTQANANLTGGTTVAENLYGMGNSISGMGIIKSTIDAGVASIQKLQTDAAVAISKMTDDYQQENYKDMLDSYNAQLAATTAIQTHIENMQKFVETQKVDAQNEAHQNLQDALDTSKFTYQQKQDAIQNAFQQQQITETQRHDLQDEATAAETAAYGRYQYDPTTGTVLDKATGKVTQSDPAIGGTTNTTPGNTGIPLLDQNTKFSATGVPYVDGTNLTGAQATLAQKQAANKGIPYLGKTQAATAGNIDTLRGDIQNMQNTLTDLGPQNILQRGINTIGNPVSEYFQVGSNSPDLSSYDGYRTVAIKAIAALAGTGSGNRITQPEINAMTQNIPSPNDSAATIKAKFAVLNGQITQAEKSVFGTGTYDQYNSDQATNDLKTYASASPTHETQVEQIHNSYPNLTPDQVLQLVQP